MKTYVKYFRNSDFGSLYGYGYVNEHLTDEDGNDLVVIITQDNRQITRSIKNVSIISEQEYIDSKDKESSW